MRPRGYQSEAWRLIVEAWLIHRAVLYQLATGGGKSIVFRLITDWAYSQGLKVLILAHRDNLLSQASGHLHGAGIYHGFISPRYPSIGCDVQIASVQTVVRRLGSIPRPDIIIVDEAHHARASTYERVLEAYPDAKVLGVTATPERTDGKGLGDIFTHMIQGPPMRWLIDEGFLSSYRYYAPDAPQEFISLDDEDELIEVVDKPKITGCAIDHWRRLANGMPTLTACINIDHAEHVAHEFKAAGLRAAALHSALDEIQVEERLGGIKAGRYDLLSFCDMIGEGFDVPGVGALVKLRPTGSLTVDLQHDGRALRADYGPGDWPKTKVERLHRIATGPKPYSVILDHVGNWVRHGMPDDERKWSLEGKAGRAGVAVTLKRCPECFRMASIGASLCAHCGHEFTAGEGRALPEYVEGQLVEIGGDRLLYDAIKDERCWSVVQARGIAATMGHRPELGERIFHEVFAR